MHKPDREGGRYAGAACNTNLSISPLLTRGLVHESPVFAIYSTFTKSVPVRPKVSGWYISSALAGGATKVPGVVARATYE
jgi:hypothetical protein